jgi:hypothetical protein
MARKIIHRHIGNKMIKLLPLIEGVSNADDALKRILGEFDKLTKKGKGRTWEWLPNGKFEFWLYKDKPKKLGKNIKIVVRFNEKYKDSQFRTPYKSAWAIDIMTPDWYSDARFYGKPKAYEDVVSVLAHEITHASQEINNSLHQHHFWDTKQGRSDEKKYGIHATKPTEQEAVLVQLITAIDRGAFQVGFEKLHFAPEYFRNFPFKLLVKKAYSLGVDKKKFMKFQKWCFDVQIKKEIFKADIDSSLLGMIDPLFHLAPLKLIHTPAEYKKIWKWTNDAILKRLKNDRPKKMEYADWDKEYKDVLKYLKKAK